MNNFYFKEESYYSLFIPWVWSTIKEIKLNDFKDNLPDLIFYKLK